MRYLKAYKFKKKQINKSVILIFFFFFLNFRWEIFLGTKWWEFFLPQPAFNRISLPSDTVWSWTNDAANCHCQQSIFFSVIHCSCLNMLKAVLQKTYLSVKVGGREWGETDWSHFNRARLIYCWRSSLLSALHYLESCVHNLKPKWPSFRDLKLLGINCHQFTFIKPQLSDTRNSYNTPLVQLK